MMTKIQKWGNSQGLRFSKTILAEADIHVGDEVRVSVQEGKIIVEPAHQAHHRYDIRELVTRMPDDYLTEEVDWGPPQGREAW